jgi:hypothetical protein
MIIETRKAEPDTIKNLINWFFQFSLLRSLKVNILLRINFVDIPKDLEITLETK